MITILKRLNFLSLLLSYAAIAVFLIMGTVNVLVAESGNPWIYFGFVQLPVLLAYLTAPLSLFCAWLMLRNRAIDPSLTLSFVVLSFVLTAWFKLNQTSGWIGAASWVALVFFLKENIRRYAAFVDQISSSTETTNPSIEQS